jgi:MFS family permease
MASGTLGAFLMAWPLGLLSDRLDRRLVVIGAAITAAATLFIMMVLIPNDAPRLTLYLCVALIGGTIVPTYSIVMAHVNDAVPKGEFLAASGGLLIMQGAGAAVEPVIAGLAMSAFERGLSYTLIITQILMAVCPAGLLRLRFTKVLLWWNRLSLSGPSSPLDIREWISASSRKSLGLFLCVHRGRSSDAD